MENTKENEFELMELSSDLAKLIYEELGENVFLCYQCVKCTTGCPLGNYFDWQPNQIMRMTQLGQENDVLDSETPWLCASCQTCSTRCPQGLDVAKIMDFITREALERGIKPKSKEVDSMNKAFMREIKMWGKAYELGLIAEMKLRNKNFFEDLDIGIKMISKGKMALLPSISKRLRPVKLVEDADTKVAYYPGCSLHSTGIEYDISTTAICKALGMDLVEIEDWVCCGSTAAHKSDPEASVQLPMENLRIVEKSGFSEVTMPCAACFNRHKVAQYDIRNHDGMSEQINQSLGYEFQDSVDVTTLMDSLIGNVGLDKIEEATQKRLAGLKAVAYYGCLLTRPHQVTEAKNPENPTEIDKILEAMGVEVLDWSYKTSCCGASHSVSRPEIVLDLSRNLIDKAKEAGADVIAVACPMCHANLDARQMQMEIDEPIPVMYFTQLLGVALGLPEKETAIQKNIIDPRPLLRKKELI